MKILYLVRHAKAINRNRLVADDKRPLSKRGRKDARAMAQNVRHHGPTPEVLIASTAARAIETAKRFAKVYTYPSRQILTYATIYDEADSANAQTLLRIIQPLDNSFQRHLLLGSQADCFFTQVIISVRHKPLLFPIPEQLHPLVHLCVRQMYVRRLACVYHWLGRRLQQYREIA